MRKTRPELFSGRHFQDRVIVLCVRWYLRYCLTLRDLEEMMAERGLGVDHSTIGRWVLGYAPELRQANSPRHPLSMPANSILKQRSGNSLYANDKTEPSRCSDGWGLRNGSRLRPRLQGHDQLAVPLSRVSGQTLH